MRLNTAKRRHLVSGYATVCHMLRQMEEAAGEGRSPTGVGAPLTPLSPEESEPVLAPVRGVKARLHDIAEQLAPGELSALERPQSRMNTLVWLSNLLDRVRVAVDELQPSRMSKYGPVGEEEREAFAAIHEELLGSVQAARLALEEMTERVGSLEHGPRTRSRVRNP